MFQKESDREIDFNKYERVWDKRIRRCELANQNFRERVKENRDSIGFKKWDREAWSDVSGFGYADTECKHRKWEK